MLSAVHGMASVTSQQGKLDELSGFVLGIRLPLPRLTNSYIVQAHSRERHIKQPIDGGSERTQIQSPSIQSLQPTYIEPWRCGYRLKTVVIFRQTSPQTRPIGQLRRHAARLDELPRRRRQY